MMERKKTLLILFVLLISASSIDSYSQTAGSKRTGVKLVYDNQSARLYTIVKGRRYFIGTGMFGPNTWGKELEPVVDPGARHLFYISRVGCGFENHGMAVSVSDVYGRKNSYILGRCDHLEFVKFLKSKGRYYLLIQESSDKGCDNSLWLYDISAQQFVVHADGGIEEKKKGVFSYEVNCRGVGALTIRTLLTKGRPLKLLPRCPTQALTRRSNTMVYLTGTDMSCDHKTADGHKVIPTVGTRVLVLDECGHDGYVIFLNGIRGKVLKHAVEPITCAK